RIHEHRRAARGACASGARAGRAADRMVKYAVANSRLSSRGRAAMRVIVLLCLFLWPGFALAEEPTITVTVADQTRIFTRDQLLARPDAATIQVPRDITYRVPLTYRA